VKCGGGGGGGEVFRIYIVVQVAAADEGLCRDTR